MSSLFLLLKSGTIVKWMGVISRFDVGDIMTDQNKWIRSIVCCQYHSSLPLVYNTYWPCMQVPLLTYLFGTGHELTYGRFDSINYGGLIYLRYCHINQTLGFGKIGGRIPMIQGVTLCFCWPYGHDWCSTWYDCYLWCYYRSRFILPSW